jgi:hypothetical protein
MEVMDEFSNTHMELEEYLEIEDVFEGEVEVSLEFRNYMVDHKVLQLKNNFILKGLVPLEKLFDINNTPIKHVVPPKDENIDDCNIEIEHEPKYINFLKKSMLSISKHIWICSKSVYMCFHAIMC